MKLFFLAIFLPFFIYATETYTYIEIPDNKPPKTISWTVEEKEGIFSANAESEDNKTNMEFTLPQNLTTVIYDSKEEDLKINYVRNGSKLFIEKIRGNYKRQKVYNIGNTPWIQRFEFGFKPFLQSHRKSMKFYIVSPKDLSLNKLVIRKKRMQKLPFNGSKVNAQKVIISPPGFKSMFWEAVLWFDEKGEDLLRYRTNEGPGTPMFTIYLKSKT